MKTYLFFPILFVANLFYVSSSTAQDLLLQKTEVIEWIGDTEESNNSHNDLFEYSLTSDNKLATVQVKNITDNGRSHIGLSIYIEDLDTKHTNQGTVYSISPTLPFRQLRILDFTSSGDSFYALCRFWDRSSTSIVKVIGFQYNEESNNASLLLNREINDNTPSLGLKKLLVKEDNFILISKNAQSNKVSIFDNECTLIFDGSFMLPEKDGNSSFNACIVRSTIKIFSNYYISSLDLSPDNSSFRNLRFTSIKDFINLEDRQTPVTRSLDIAVDYANEVFYLLYQYDIAVRTDRVNQSGDPIIEQLPPNERRMYNSVIKLDANDNIVEPLTLINSYPTFGFRSPEGREPKGQVSFNNGDENNNAFLALLLGSNSSAQHQLLTLDQELITTSTLGLEEFPDGILMNTSNRRVLVGKKDKYDQYGAFTFHLSNNSFPENVRGLNSLIGNFIAEGIYAINNLTFEILPEEDHEGFVLNADNQLRTNAIYNFEEQSVCKLKVRCGPVNNFCPSLIKTLYINIENRNDQPMQILLNQESIDDFDNLETNFIASIRTIDDDPNDYHSYRLVDTPTVQSTEFFKLQFICTDFIAGGPFPIIIGDWYLVSREDLEPGEYWVRIKSTDPEGLFVTQTIRLQFNPNDNSRINRGYHENNIVAYPNPTSGLLNLRFTNQKPDNINLSISSLDGRTVLKKKVSNISDISFDLSNEARGAYIIKALNINNQEVITKKIILK